MTALDEKVLLWLALGLSLFLIGATSARADVQPDARPITWKRCSSTIAVGGTAQTITLPNQALRGFFLQNPCAATESLFYDPTGTASTTSGTSPELAACASVSFGPGTIFAGTISVNAVTTGHAYVCEQGQ